MSQAAVIAEPKTTAATRAPDWLSLVDPAFLAGVSDLPLRAQAIVEGFLSGLHRSPYVGFSTEFASHREYVPGDDPRHVNWKLYARHGRLYVKQFDADTNLCLYLLLDVSRSMECASQGTSKLDYAAALTAALACLALGQRDAVSLTLFADRIVGHLPPSSKARRFEEVCQAIVATGSRPVSDARKALHPAAELARQRGLVVVVSDFFDDLAALLSGLDHFRFRGHEVVAFHVLDPWERELPEAGFSRFRDLETGAEIPARAEAVRTAYAAEVDRWRGELRRELERRSIDFVELTTRDRLDAALVSYLQARSKRC